MSLEVTDRVVKEESIRRQTNMFRAATNNRFHQYLIILSFKERMSK